MAHKEQLVAARHLVAVANSALRTAFEINLSVLGEIKLVDLIDDERMATGIRQTDPTLRDVFEKGEKYKALLRTPYVGIKTIEKIEAILKEHGLAL